MAQGLVDYIKRGTHDDGGEGVIRTKVAQGELVSVPFFSTLFYSGAGSSSAYASQATDNPVPGQPINLSLAQSLQSYAGFKAQLRGRVIGVRFRRHNAFTIPTITAVIDGVAYPLREANTRLDTVPTSYQNFDGANPWIIADDLSDGPHTVTIHVNGDNTRTFSMVFHGWLVERSKGYPADWPYFGNWVTQALTATATTIASSGGQARDLVFTNTGATQRVVQLQTSGGTVLQEVIVAAAGTAGSTQKIAAQRPFTLSNYKVKQDTGTDVVLSYLAEGFVQ